MRDSSIRLGSDWILLISVFCSKFEQMSVDMTVEWRVIQFAKIWFLSAPYSKEGEAFCKLNPSSEKSF